jgi:hypothetical protein
MAHKRISASKKKKNSQVTAQEPQTNYNKQPIIFSLERIVSGNYCFTSLDKPDKEQFAEAIFRRKNLTWEEVYSAQRHGLGTEKISVKSISEEKPRFITDDITDYLALRYNGKKAMVGIRQKNIFYVLWFDHNFSLYDHGS